MDVPADAGRADSEPAPTRKPAPTVDTREQRPKRTRVETPARDDAPRRRVRRGAAGTALRGHLIPDALHRQARRRKVELGARHATRITWDDVMSDAVSILIDRPDDIGPILDELHRSHDAAARCRLVQATVPAELDRRFMLVHLDLNERGAGTVRYEQLWAAALMLWLRSTA